MKAEKSIKKYDYDVAVLGAGPAGIMAAGKAARFGASVVLIEKNFTLAKKLLLTGNGRCNFTNAEFNLSELVKNYNNGKFLFHIFSVFGPKETIKFFEELGVKTKIEKNKRVFPASDSAQEVLEALEKYLAENKVNIIFNSEVINVDHSGKKINKLILKDFSTGLGNGREITAKKYILCTGGKSYPLTGSDGFGYKLAKKLGHTIVKPLPALSSIRIKEKWVKNLQGISLKGVKITVFQKGKKRFQEEGSILFTHFGVSGPAVLNISANVGDLLENGLSVGQAGEAKICFDLAPLLNQGEFGEKINEILKKYPKKKFKNILSDFAPEKLAEILLDIAGVDKNKMAGNVSKIERGMTAKIFKNFEVTAESIFGFNEAKTTRGGISLAEIDGKTMRSKIIDNLFFAGEVIDVDGKTGGFNLQMCWSTGCVAGESCGQESMICVT
ncbi:MAG: hypothetical protein US76_01575 [Parcubacteria group bacterium GW2011_GWA2_38_13b]|nr:MAG: hypothetical protein US76_01575 [Parcubacteria group bacterium GW2011_GWA2_38_13b]